MTFSIITIILHRTLDRNFNYNIINARGVSYLLIILYAESIYNYYTIFTQTSYYFFDGPFDEQKRLKYIFTYFYTRLVKNISHMYLLRLTYCTRRSLFGLTYGEVPTYCVEFRFRRRNRSRRKSNCSKTYMLFQ